VEKLKKIFNSIDNNIKFLNLKKIYSYIYKILAKFNLFFLRKNHAFKNIHYSNSNNILCKLSQKHGSDKGWQLNEYEKSPFKWKPHTFTTFYHSIFDFNRDNAKLVFECGIGTNKEGLKSSMGTYGKPGASLRMWRDYFYNANIYGADIDKGILFNEDRINTYFVDQLDSETIKSMWNNIGLKDFDIIIDDGLHEVDANLNFFHNSFNKLKKNGIYVIEDVKLFDLNTFSNKLKDFNPEIIVLDTKGINDYINNNLVIIRKN
jgi:hypothetical protein|tara:strand:- start:352 stop:1137 length:786 start_codon:yes stop_codon:yes gene_type:complete